MNVREGVRKALPDLMAGAVFLAFGVAFGLTAATYEIGTPLAMGPGFFPLALAAILVVLGVAVIAGGFLSQTDAVVGHIPWRGIALLTLAFIIFGLTVRNLGVGPSLFVATLLASLGSQRTSWLGAIAIAAGLTVLTVLIFIVGLQLRLPLFGPWLSFPSL